METSPVLPPSVEESSSANKKKSRKRNKKNVENLGSFIVETNPERNKEKPSLPDVKTTESMWSRRPKPDVKSVEAPVKNAEQKDTSGEENDTTPELDAEAPLEHATIEERRAIFQTLGEVREGEISDELASVEPETLEAEQTEAAQEFMAIVIETGDPDLAAERVAELHDLEPIELPEAEIVESWVESTDEEDREAADEIDTNEPNEGEIYHNADDPEEADDDTVVSGNGTGATAGGSGGSGGSSGGSTPPTSGGASSGGGGGPIPIPTAGMAAGAAAPRANPNTISTATAHYYERRALGRGLLVGGIVGYLVGRRRGRIKTEKKLLPVQKKLEKEVKSLESRLIDSEYAVRKAVAQREQARPVKAARNNKVVSSDRSIQERPATIDIAKIAPIIERRRAAEAAKVAVSAIEAGEHRKSVEIAKTNSPSVPLERIGHVIVAAESLPAKRSQSVEKVAAQPSAITAEKQAMTMPRTELMQISEKISVEGTSLRQVYETHLIGERGLRRLVAEHLRGGNVQKALRREIIEREIDFERDPILRDRARASVSGGGRGALGSLLQEAGAVAVATKEIVAPEKTKDDKTPSEAPQKKASNHHLADLSLITVIVVLIILVIAIAMRAG
jgi:hypothetical protein